MSYLIRRLEFSAQWAFSWFVFIRVMQNVYVIGFSLFYLDPDGLSISNLYRFFSLCIWWTTSSAYNASNCFVSKNRFCNYRSFNTHITNTVPWWWLQPRRRVNSAPAARGFKNGWGGMSHSQTCDFSKALAMAYLKRSMNPKLLKCQWSGKTQTGSWAKTPNQSS